MGTVNSIDNHALLAALGHPLRLEILRAMSGERPLSPRELAEELDEPLGNVAYHVRVLARYGALELEREEKVRGTIQHFYRAAAMTGWLRTLLLESGGSAGS